MGTDQVHTVSGLRGRIVVFGRMIRFSHSVFALPFALSGVLFAAHVYDAFPGIDIWFWVAMAMVGARSAAMALNRIVDCMQVMGANGMRDEHSHSRHLASAKMAQYLDGATEVQNVVIARGLLRPHGVRVR